jgi:hypothetical protein
LRRCANRHKVSREKVSGRMQGRFANRPYPGLAVVRGESPAYRLYIWVESVKITKVPVPWPDRRGTPPAVMKLGVILSPFASLRVNSAKDRRGFLWSNDLRETAEILRFAQDDRFQLCSHVQSVGMYAPPRPLFFVPPRLRASVVQRFGLTGRGLSRYHGRLAFPRNCSLWGSGR